MKRLLLLFCISMSIVFFAFHDDINENQQKIPNSQIDSIKVKVRRLSFDRLIFQDEDSFLQEITENDSIYTIYKLNSNVVQQDQKDSTLYRYFNLLTSLLNEANSSNQIDQDYYTTNFKGEILFNFYISDGITILLYINRQGYIRVNKKELYVKSQKLDSILEKLLPNYYWDFKGKDAVW